MTDPKEYFGKDKKDLQKNKQMFFWKLYYDQGASLPYCIKLYRKCIGLQLGYIEALQFLLTMQSGASLFHCLSCLFFAALWSADLYAALCVVLCVFVTFPYGFLGQVCTWLYQFLIFAFRFALNLKGQMSSWGLRSNDLSTDGNTHFIKWNKIKGHQQIEECQSWFKVAIF